MMRLTKSSFLFYFILQFKACVFTTILSPADRTLNGQDAELVCTYSTNIASTSTVYVNWLENGNIRGNIDNRCSDAGRPVDTTQYNFSCPSISNYTWTIKNAQESRNGTKWTCAIAIDSLTYTTSDPTTMYVISPITSVSIDGNANISADAKSQTTVSCTTSTGRPVSTIHWYFDAGTPLNTSDDEEITSASEPVFDFGSETTSGSVTITAESNRNRWGIYATANNTESMTPIRSSNAVTLTVTEIQTSTVSNTVISSTPASIDPTPGGCKICKWFVIIPCCWCIVLIVIVVLIIIIIIAGGCTLGYWWYKGIYLFDTPRKWPCSSSKPPKVERSAAASHVEMSGNSSEKSNDVHKGLSGKPPDGERIASASHVEMGDISSEKSSFVPKGLSGIHSGRSAGTGIRVFSTTDERSHKTNLSRTTVHVDNQVNDKTKGRRNLPPIIGNAKVVPDGNPDKNTAGQITEVNNTHRALPKPPGIGSEVSSQEPNMGDVEANKQKRKKKKKKKSKETEKDQLV